MYQIMRPIILISLLALASSKCFAEDDLTKEIGSSSCNYDHLLEEKQISKSDPEKKGNFRKHFLECIPLHGEWVAKAVEQMNPDKRDMVRTYQKLQHGHDGPEKPFAKLLTDRLGRETLVEAARDRVKFYLEIVSVQVEQMCSGFDGALKEISKIYDLVTDEESDTWRTIDQVDFQQDTSPITFEWVTYARDCEILVDNDDYLSDGIRSMFSDEKDKKSWLKKLMIKAKH